jgi:hypothetical protein
MTSGMTLADVVKPNQSFRERGNEQKSKGTGPTNANACPLSNLGLQTRLTFEAPLARPALETALVVAPASLWPAT